MLCPNKTIMFLPKTLFLFLLSDNCVACHGPDVNKREAGLRLGIEEGAYLAIKERPEFHAIVPSKPNRSVLVEKI